MDANISDPSRHNKQFVITHFDDFVNKKDLAAIDRNMAADFLDHDGPGGKRVGRAEDREMMAAMYQLMPDLKVEVKGRLGRGRQGRRAQSLDWYRYKNGSVHGVSRFRDVAHSRRQDRRTLGYRHAAARSGRAVIGVVTLRRSLDPPRDSIIRLFRPSYFVL